MHNRLNVLFTFAIALGTLVSAAIAVLTYMSG